MLSYGKKKAISIITVVTAVILLCCWIFVAVLYLNTVDAGKYNEKIGVRFIAHRGYSGKYFQNTIEAFEAAGVNGFFQGVETDVRATSDGVFVCSHDDDPFLDRSVKISEKTFDEIKDLPLDLSRATENVDITLPYRICTLSDYLKTCGWNRKIAVVEIKQKFDKEETLRLCEFVFNELPKRNVIFCTFDRNVLDYVINEYSDVNAKLFTSKKALVTLYAELGYNVGVSYKNLSESKIEKCHKKGVYVDAYTVNDVETAKKLIGFGVDFITTDEVLAL